MSKKTSRNKTKSAFESHSAAEETIFTLAAMLATVFSFFLISCASLASLAF